MNPAERTKEALLGICSPLFHYTASVFKLTFHTTARSESLCNAIYDDRNPDPYGGDGYLSNILRAARLEETSENTTLKSLGEARDFATSAQKELTIRDQATGLVRATSSCTLGAVGGLTSARSKPRRILVPSSATCRNSGSLAASTPSRTPRTRKPPARRRSRSRRWLRAWRRVSRAGWNKTIWL